MEAAVAYLKVACKDASEAHETEPGRVELKAVEKVAPDWGQDQELGSVPEDQHWDMGIRHLARWGSWIE
jgi:hypothetical protein